MIVSVIHIAKGKVTLPVVLDGQIVPAISAFLFHAGGHEDPEKLAENAGKSFQGSILLGMGFTFDDSDAADEANSIAFKDELIRKNSRNADLIFPYIGGEEVNDSPTHEHRRFAINFGEMCEEDARSWPDLMAIVEDKVKPGRMAQKDRGAKQRWWQFIRPRPELYSAIAHNRRVLVVSRVRATGFAFMSPGMIFSEQLVVFPLESYSAFLVLQSRVHECWARFFSGSALDLIRYSPSSCFETFPFPVHWEDHPALEAAGKILLRVPRRAHGPRTTRA